MSQAKQETLLDYNPTEMELFSATSCSTEQEYQIVYKNQSLDTIYTHIYTLYGIRENTVKALEYLNKIQDKAIKKRLTEPRFRI